MTLAMLSWGAHRTLINTLESLKFYGANENENIIWFQEISKEDRRIAAKYGFTAYGSSDNIGIAQAYKNLVDIASGETFLFLENDWMAVGPTNRLNAGKELLYSRVVDVVRYRHRRNPGHPLWTLQYQGNELTAPTHLLDCVHWRQDPDKDFSEYVSYKEGFYFASSRNANWTNNPTMFRTDWLRENILPRIGNRDIEVDLQQWWEQQDFTVAQDSVGIFKHHRIG